MYGNLFLVAFKINDPNDDFYYLTDNTDII